MSAAEPREIRLSEIPTELRNLRAEIERQRARWAQDLTRAEELERKLRQATEARDAARQTCDDLTDHCERQGKRIVLLEISLVAHRAFVRDIWDQCEVEYRVPPTIQDVRDVLREFLEIHGADCEECRGSGEVADEEMVPWGGSSNGYSTRTIGVECSDCADGKVPAR